MLVEGEDGAEDPCHVPAAGADRFSERGVGTGVIGAEEDLSVDPLRQVHHLRRRVDFLTVAPIREEADGFFDDPGGQRHETAGGEDRLQRTPLFQVFSAAAGEQAVS